MSRLSFFLFSLILLMAAALRLWQIDSLPPGFHFDESFEGVEAWRILTDNNYRPLYLTGNFGVPPLNSYANALMFALFGLLGGEAGPVAMRVTAACFGLLGVWAVYGLGLELGRLEGSKLSLSIAFPLLAAAVLAIMRWHIHFSRMGIEPIIVPFIWALTHWLFLHGFRTGRWLSFIGAGIALAAGMYSYRGAWVIPFLMIPVGLHLLFYYRKINHSNQIKQIGGVALTAIVSLIIFLPLGWTFWQNPSLLFLRLSHLNILGESGSPADATIFNNVQEMANMFGPFGIPGDLDPRRNLPGAAALNLWLAIPFYLGLLLAFTRLKRPTYSILLIGLFGLLAPGVISEYAPHFHRVLGGAAPAALLCAVGLDFLWQWRPAKTLPIRWAGAALTLLLLLFGSATSAQNYFVRWASMPSLYYAFDVGLWDVGQWIAQQPNERPIYLTPRDANHPTLAFAYESKPDGHPAPISFDGRHIFPLNEQLTSEREAYIVIGHEDFRTPLLLPDIFPELNATHNLFDAQDQFYARIYERPKGMQPQREPFVNFEAALGDGISLIGYDIQPAALRPGEILYLQLHWSVTKQPQSDWTVFTHLIELSETADGSNPNTGKMVAGHDSQPGSGSLPTLRWQAGWRLLDEYQIQLPHELMPGTYGLKIGLYQFSGEQLPESGEGLFLGTVLIE